MIYKIKMNDLQKNTINQIWNDSKRAKVFSVYSYILKNTEDGYLKYSVCRTHKLYCRYKARKYKISETYFKELVNVLCDFKMLTKEGQGKSQRIRVTDFTTNKITKDIKQPEVQLSFVDTSIEADEVAEEIVSKEESKKIEKVSNVYNTQDLHISNYIENLEKVRDWNFVEESIEKVRKAMGVRKGNSVYYDVYVAVERAYKSCKGITIKYLDKYIANTITNIRERVQARRDEFMLNRKVYKASQLNFNMGMSRVYSHEFSQQIEDFFVEQVNNRECVV